MMRSVNSILSTGFALLILGFGGSARAALPIPAKMEQVDYWWKRCRLEGKYPSVAELESHDPDSPIVVYALDAMLSTFHEQRQRELLDEYLTAAEDCEPGSLLTLWLRAWAAWIAAVSDVEGDEEDSVRDVAASLSSEQVHTVRSLVEPHCDKITGAIALRLLTLRGGEGALEPEGALFELAEELLAEEPASGCAAWITMQRGTEAEKDGQLEPAVRHWLRGLENYPFRREIGQWRDRIAAALSGFERARQREVVAAVLGEEGESGALILARARLHQARTLAREQRYSDVLEVLTEIRDEAKTRADDSEDWNDLHMEVEVELFETRVTAGSETAVDRVLSRIREAKEDEFTPLLADGIEKSGQDEAFTAVAFRITEARMRDRIGAGREAWHLIASADAVSERLRAMAYDRLLELAQSDLLLHRRLQLIDSPFLETVPDRVVQKSQEIEDRFLDLLAEAENFVHRPSPNWALIQLADSLYAYYKSLGIRNLPEGVYIHLARDASSQQRDRLAELAERMDRSDEAIEILRTEIKERGLGDENGEQTPGHSMKVALHLMELLSDQGEYEEAIQLARRLAEREGVDSGRLRTQQYNLALLHYKNHDYHKAKEIIAELLAGQDIGPVPPAKVEKLLALVEYRLGNYKEAMTLMEKLDSEGGLDIGEEHRFVLMRAYSALYSQNYAEAYEEFRLALEEYDALLSPEERNQIERIVEKLKSFVN